MLRSVRRLWAARARNAHRSLDAIGAFVSQSIRGSIEAGPEVGRNELPTVVGLLHAVRLAKLGNVDNEGWKIDVLSGGLIEVLARDGEDVRASAARGRRPRAI